MIIDCHCHAGKGDGLTGPWDTSAPLERYLARARYAGIARTVVFSVFHSDYELANRNVASIVARHSSRLIGFAFVNPKDNAGHVHDLVLEAVTDYGFRGIKIHQHDGRVTREVCEVARKFRLPIIYDVMGEITTVELVAAEYPSVNFVIPHLGSFADDYRIQLGFIDQLVRCPNVYTDTAGIRRFDLLEEAVKRAGAHKVLFGSDGPFLHPGVELFKIRALGLTKMEEQRILGENLLGLICNQNQSAGCGRVTRRPVPYASAMHGRSP